MNLAIKTLQFAPVGENELNLPLDFPWQVKELGSSTVLPDDSGQWTLLTLAEWNEGAAARAASVAAAVAAMQPPPVIYYVRAKCSDSMAQDELFNELVGRNFDSIKYTR